MVEKILDGILIFALASMDIWLIIAVTLALFVLYEFKTE